eukprot:195873-Prymnesium_polylepis.1
MPPGWYTVVSRDEAANPIAPQPAENVHEPTFSSRSRCRRFAPPKITAACAGARVRSTTQIVVHMSRRQACFVVRVYATFCTACQTSGSAA